MATLKGVVEGFDWPDDRSIDGHWGELRPEERMYLIASLHTFGFDTFLYDPRALRARNADPLALLMDPAHWPATFDAARDHGISFIWGIAPGQDKGGLMDGVERLLDLGVDGVALLFDDDQESDLEKRCRAQGYIARNIEARFPGAVRAFRGAGWDGGTADAIGVAEILDEELPQSVGLIWSGGRHEARLARDHHPELGRRAVWAWDQGAVVDTSDPAALHASPLKGRSDADLEGLGAWLIEMTYPLGRALPAIAGAGLSSGATKVDEDEVIKGMVKAWKRWFHDIETDALHRLLAILAGRGVADDLTEGHRVALRCKPDLRHVVDALTGPPPELT